MAGDWIKMRIDLQTHPKVVRILSATKSDKFRALGGLHAVWSVFDTHSVDGALFGYTPETLDHVIGWIGFSDAMIAVGWLAYDGIETLVLPEFDEHNGKSGKRRAEDQKRKKNDRKCPENVRNLSEFEPDEKLTREEKRRDISTSLRSVDKPKAPRKKATQFPEDFTPCETAVSKLTAAGISVSTEVSKFRDHCHSKGKTFVDWQAGFRTWASNAVEWAKPQPNAGKSGNQSAVDRRIDIANQMFGSITGGNNGRVIEHG